VALIPVALAGRSYQVEIGRDLLERAGELAAGLLRKASVPVVADRNAWNLHGARIEQGLAKAGKTASVYIVEPGENSKSWESLARLTDWLLAEQVERGDHVLAFGGGVVGDLTGFAAAILKRGCGFIQIPTTLLAQVDSSVGGKTAINTAAGKNLVGAFHQPSLVLADLTALDTLPPRELRAGYAEVLKYGVLGDRGFFDWLGKHGPNVLALEEAPLERAVATSVAMKAAVVAEDERETTGRRALLNLGHTFGHALEAETGFGERALRRVPARFDQPRGTGRRAVHRGRADIGSRTRRDYSHRCAHARQRDRHLAVPASAAGGRSEGQAPHRPRRHGPCRRAAILRRGIR
jgi:3-dehydroquinate synthase